MFIKPYFRSEDTRNAKLDELETPVKLDELEIPLPTKEVPQKPTEPAEPTVKRGWGRPWKYSVTKSAVMEIYLTSAGISARQYPPTDILVLVQETPFTDLWCKEINRLFKKGVFVVMMERDILQSVCIFNSRFINKIKYPSIDRAFKKSRLII